MHQSHSPQIRTLSPKQRYSSNVATFSRLLFLSLNLSALPSFYEGSGETVNVCYPQGCIPARIRPSTTSHGPLRTTTLATLQGHAQSTLVTLVRQEACERERVGSGTMVPAAKGEEDEERGGLAGVQRWEACDCASEDEGGAGPGEEPDRDEALECAENAGVSEGKRRLSAEDEFRLALAYTAAYPLEETRARAAIYGEENPHFTVQRARAQVGAFLCENAFIHYAHRNDLQSSRLQARLISLSFLSACSAASP